MKAVISEYVAHVAGESIVPVPAGSPGAGLCLATREALEAGRTTALAAMDDQARELGADAVVGVDLDSDLMDQQTVVIRASGLAVRLSCGTAVRIVREPATVATDRVPEAPTERVAPTAAYAEHTA
jgi:uncharacterized protein YbjQ (UPF0145 family)